MRSKHDCAAIIVACGGSAEPVATDATLEDDVVRLFDRAMAPGDGFGPPSSLYPTRATISASTSAS